MRLQHAFEVLQRIGLARQSLHDGQRWEVRRQMRWKQPKQYLAQIAKAAPVQEEFAVEAGDLPFEFMMNALRLNQGFEPDLFAMRTSLPLITIENELRRAEQQGLIERQPQRIAPTLHGQRFLNRLIERFMSERG